MSVINKSFNEVFNHTRGTGATHISPTTGFIVGVDFSTTSNTIGTGSKTFTLTADANVNREWVVGENVLVTAQAGATGTMTGVVTSYTPSTQVLVVNVTSTTGSGTSTDWRIGSLEVRRGADGLLVEVAASNAAINSESFQLIPSTNLTVVANQAVAPNGSVAMDRITSVGGLASIGTNAQFNLGPGNIITVSVYVQAVNPNTNNVFRLCHAPGGIASSDFTATETPRRFTFTFPIVIANNNQRNGICSPSTNAPFDIYVWGLQIEVGSFASSYIPTTTVSWTRNADTVTLNSTALQNVRQGQGVIYVDADGEGSAVVASGDNGKKLSVPFINKIPFAAYNKARFLLTQFPAAAVAYSTRQLNGGVPFALRVRRSNDNAQQDIGFDSLGNLDEAALTAFVGANSAFVTTWYDQSGNARHATQATAANQPRIVNAGVVDKVNGRVTFDFNGEVSNHFLDVASLGNANNAPFSTFSVSLKKSNGNTRTSFSRVIGVATSLATNDYEASGYPADFYDAVGGVNVFGSEPAHGGFYNASARGFRAYTLNTLVSASSIYLANSHTFTQNGVAGTTVSGSNGSFVINSARFGSAVGNVAQDAYLNGNISEIILYTTDQSANRAAIESNIMSYFGITG